MGKLNELKTTAGLVKEMLEKHPTSRDSDNDLYYYVCDHINPGAMDFSFGHVLENLEVYGFPAFETVRRTRQKIQREFPHLASTERTKQARTENEVEYRSFARLKGDVEQWLK